MINHHNFVYAAGPTFPEAVGDRYYAQDLARDYWSKIDDAGRKVAIGFSAFPVLIKDSNVTKGTLYTDINIPVARGIVKYEVDIPNSYASLPPTVTQEDVYCRIETTAQTDFDISVTANLDGVTTNYVKVTYNETDGASRARAKKAGTYVYEKAVSFTITVDDTAPTDYDLVLATLVGDGATTLVIESYTRTASYNTEYDYIVSTQEDFNILIDYTAANQYKIKDNVKSIFVKSLSGGYQMTGATSPLQEGDLYGYIETNDCTRIVFEPGAFIDMHQNIGYLEVDTDYCHLNGVSIRGDKGAASAIQRSFLLNADYVTYNNCDSQTRLSNATPTYVFEGSSTASHNDSSNYINCFISDIDSSNTFRCFYKCKNIINTHVISIGQSSGSVVSIFELCENIDNFYIETIDAPNNRVSIANDCKIIKNGKIKDIDGLYTILFSTCEIISNLHIEDIDQTGAAIFNSNGFASCEIINNVKIIQMDSANNCYAYFQCDQLTNCYAEDIDSSGGNSYGFYDCNIITSCKVTDVDSGAGNYYGFYDCTEISGCLAIDCEDGYYMCSQISGCRAQGNDNNGFFDCDRISACIGNGNGNDGFEDCTIISASLATGNTGNGFDGCKNMTANRSTANTAANYLNSFADWASANACADTNLGGYNS